MTCDTNTLSVDPCGYSGLWISFIILFLLFSSWWLSRCCNKKKWFWSFFCVMKVHFHHSSKITSLSRNISWLLYLFQELPVPGISASQSGARVLSFQPECCLFPLHHLRQIFTRHDTSTPSSWRHAPPAPSSAWRPKRNFSASGILKVEKQKENQCQYVFSHLGFLLRIGQCHTYAD